MALNKQSILSHTGGVEKRDVHVPAWRDADGDDVVVVRGLVLDEMHLIGALGDEGVGAKILARVILDGNGIRVFDDEDAGQIGQLPLGGVQPLLEATLELSGVGADEAKQKAADAAIRGESGAQTTEP